ncbi:rhamnulose-1-phosphate aldolase [Collinsella tanakaei]|uniref:rhamnulose-1-phosphate aldolase n=1 Tax=Collinsella tanakaei TaxID=626935 RepID=UPI00195A180D|nr:rhamnulose-1-phosphate aldolase [Collinsella tanakaei]MBM6756844.1 rhamnulose-1-phosphate aldolase [Collinsella tanakaei]
MGMTDLDFVQGFARLCDDGFKQGWHERNGGNLTYRMTDEETEAARPFFDAEPRPWVKMGVCAPKMGGKFFMAKGTGCYMRNMLGDIEGNAGIVEINETGDAYRVRWGLTIGGKPTSEFESHFMNQAERCELDGGATRVCYHMHGPGIIEMSFIVPLEDREFTRKLWQMMTECVVVFPEGVGVVPWMVPGGPAIADATSEKMKSYRTAVWAHHGLFATGRDFDEAFGLAHTVEKAAQLYVAARAANGGSDDFLNKISDQGLKDTCRDFNIQINEAFVD